MSTTHSCTHVWSCVMQQVPVGCAGLTSSFWPAATCCLCSVSLQHGQIRLNLETHTQSFFNHFREHYINLPSFPGDQIVSTTYPSPRFTSREPLFLPKWNFIVPNISVIHKHTQEASGDAVCEAGRKPVSPLMAAEHNEDSHWAEILPAPCMTGVLLQILSMCDTMVQANTHTLTATR